MQLALPAISYRAHSGPNQRSDFLLTRHWMCSPGVVFFQALFALVYTVAGAAKPAARKRSGL